MRELANSISIKLIDASKRFLTNCFLVVRQQEPTELFALEEVLAMVIWLRHGEQILVEVALVASRGVEL